MPRLFLLVSGFLLLAFAPANAANTNSPAAPASEQTFVQPDLLSFGLAYENFDKTQSHRQAADFRGEYRWGLSLLPLVSDYFKSWDDYVQFHPFLGFETTTLTQLYGVGGFDMDWYISRHFVFTWSEGAGLFYRGSGRRMGSVLEFRSQAEFGYRFDNQMRITAEISHISNAKITRINPGAEIAGVYLHIPVGQIF